MEAPARGGSGGDGVGAWWEQGRPRRRTAAMAWGILWELASARRLGGPRRLGGGTGARRRMDGRACRLGNADQRQGSSLAKKNIG